MIMINSSKNAKFEVSLKFIIKDKDGRILLLKMPDNSQMAGYYDLPGGRIKESEKTDNLKTVAKRELTEELGKKVRLKIKENPIAVGRHTYKSKETGAKKLIFWVLFEAVWEKGEIKISSEHKDYIWKHVHRADLRKLFTKGPLESMTNYITGRFGECEA